MRRTCSLVAIFTGVVTVAACAQVLGIDDFTDAEGGAAATVTAGGAAGSGGSTSTGTSTGTGVGGSGAAPQQGRSLNFGDQGEENAAALGVTDDGSIVIAGDFTSSIDFGGGSIDDPQIDNCDAFVAKLEF